MDRLWVGLGAILGLTAVAMSAYVAHGTQGLPSGAVQGLRDAVQMQGWHALSLVGTGVWARRRSRLANLAGLAFAVGTGLFCGAVYAHTLGGMDVARLAPTGGFVLMAGWLLLGLSALRR
jgi:uncharacterized membrane protein YgdD (TMEM256/DUF423 family)